MICRYLAKFFKLYEQGDLFELENRQLIKKISLYMIIGELIQPLYQAAITATLTFNNPPGDRLAMITLGSTNMSTLITALVI